MPIQDLQNTDSLNSGKDKLNYNFKHKGYNYNYLTSTGDLNTITEDCKIVSIEAINNPEPNGSFLVDVKRFYTRETQTPIFWGVQRAYKQFKTGLEPISYTRTFSQSTTKVTWSEWRKDIKSSDLDLINNMKYKVPYIDSTKDLNTIRSEGQYFTIDAINQPATGAYKLDVKRYYSLESGLTNQNQFFGTQTLTESNSSKEVKIWVRSFAYNENTGTNGFSEWKEITKNPITGNGNSHLAGKNIIYMGDSTVEFGTMPEILASRLGANIFDIGIGGTRMAYHTNVNYDAFSGTKIVDSLVSKNWDLQETAYNNLKAINSDDNTIAFNTMKSIDLSTIDYVLIQYGTNDYMGTTDGAVPLGVSTDTTSDTFYGSINYIVDKLQKANPKIKIVFVTPHMRNNATYAPAGYSTVSPNADGKYLVEYVDAIKEIAEKYNLLAIDMYRTSGINENTFTTYIADKVHPTQLGYELLGNKVASYMLSNF